MKKRILAVLLAAVMLMAAVPTAFAANTSVTSGTCGDHVTWRANLATGTITISGTGAISDYLTEEDSQQAPWSDLLSVPFDPETYETTGDAPCDTVVIQPGVTAIGENAFALCDGLTNITIPNSVTAIGDYAFLMNYGLTSVVIPNGVTAIGEGAFSGTSLTEITIPASVTSIGPAAVNGTVVTVASDSKAFSSNAQGVLFNKEKTELLSAPSTLTTYEIPAGVVTVGEDAFSACYELTRVTLPSGVTAIEDGAFSFCVSLTGVVLPASLTSIGAGAFGWCDNLTDVYYGGTEAQWAAIDIDDSSELGDDDSNTALTSATIHYNETSDPVKPDPGVTDFTDVPAGEFYASAVKWAVENKITTGKTTTTFEPNSACTRAEIVTFLWRAYGRQEPTSMVSPFTDVTDPDAYYYKAVLWAVENKITEGTDDTTFSPNDSCTRAQAVTFLWRAAKKPAASGGEAFSDVVPGAFYADAVAWAVENKITTGTGGGKFSPEDTCTRGQIVTFLHRDLVGE